MYALIDSDVIDGVKIKKSPIPGLCLYQGIVFCRMHTLYDTLFISSANITPFSFVFIYEGSMITTMSY